jgi:hypothetical protein
MGSSGKATDFKLPLALRAPLLSELASDGVEVGDLFDGI